MVRSGSDLREALRLDAFLTTDGPASDSSRHTLSGRKFGEEPLNSSPASDPAPGAAEMALLVADEPALQTVYRVSPRASLLVLLLLSLGSWAAICAVAAALLTR